MNEVWKDIYYYDIKTNNYIDYRGIYQISNLGRIKSLGNEKSKKDKILKQNQNNKSGYMEVRLCTNNKMKVFLVHRLVAYMFIKNDDTTNKVEVNHKDENPLNNHVDNLEWCTSKYNANYGTRNERINKFKYGNKIAQYSKDGSLIKIWNNVKEASDDLQISHGHISSCCTYYEKGDEWWRQNRKQNPVKSYKGFIWKYYKD